MKTYQEFNDEDWGRAKDTWGAWWAGTFDRPIIVIEAVDLHQQQNTATGAAATSLKVRDLDGFITQFPLSTPEEAILDQIETNLSAIYYVQDAYPKWWPNFGPGVMAGFLGSRVEYRPGTTWFHPLKLDSLADLRLEFDPDNPWWRRAVGITDAAVARWGDRFTIGHTDLGGNLDILASLRGSESLLLDLMDVPEVVDRCVEKITGLWLEYYQHIQAIIEKSPRGFACWAPCWQPSPGYMLQSDFSYMISPKMFDRWVAPDLTTICDYLDYGFYHLDGPGQLRHVDALLAIPELKGIQWIPGAGSPQPEEWPELLEKILAAGKRCQVYVTPAGAHKLMNELDCTGLAIVLREDNGERNLSLEEADDFLSSIPVAIK